MMPPIRPIPPIEAVMTPLPVSIGIDARVTEAQELMADHDIRHLPVTDGGEIVGVITQRDVGLVLDPARGLPFDRDLRVRTICMPDAYVVAPETPLDTVVGEMARRRIGSVLVARAGLLLGIFTATDACRLYAETLRDGPSP
jgi:acetoin utilization protein AcuB